MAGPKLDGAVVQNVTMLEVWNSALAWLEATTGITNYALIFTVAFAAAEDLELSRGADRPVVDAVFGGEAGAVQPHGGPGRAEGRAETADHRRRRFG